MHFTKMQSLREKAFGEWEGLTFEEVERSHPSMFRSVSSMRMWTLRRPEARATTQLYARMKDPPPTNC